MRFIRSIRYGGVLDLRIHCRLHVLYRVYETSDVAILRGRGMILCTDEQARPSGPPSIRIMSPPAELELMPGRRA